MLARVIIGADQVDLHLAPDALCQLLQADPAPVPPARSRQPVVLRIPAQLRRCGAETKLIVPGRATGSTPARPSAALIKALVRAHTGLDRLHADVPGGPSHDLARILPLAFLAWPEQRRVLGFSSIPTATG